MTNFFVQVEGMTCNHCVNAVVKEVSLLDDVADVSVSLEPEGTSAVSFTAPQVPSAESLRAAIDEAGYEMVGEVQTA